MNHEFYDIFQVVMYWFTENFSNSFYKWEALLTSADIVIFIVIFGLSIYLRRLYKSEPF